MYRFYSVLVLLRAGVLLLSLCLMVVIRQELLPQKLRVSKAALPA